MVNHTGPIVAARDGLTVIDCAGCGWAHLWPMPETPAGYYETEFWQATKRDWLAKYEAQRDWIDATNGDYLAALAAHTEGTALLDVGSGYGFLLRAAEDTGWTAYGIEPSESAASYSRSQSLASIHRGNWEDCRTGRYSAISAMWLMEHLPNPLEFLKWCRAHLRENGALLLAVPNEWTALQAEASDAAKVPFYWVHPTHLNYWSAATFANLLGRAGFRIVDRLGTFEMEKYLLRGHDYTVDESLGAVLHASVRAIELGHNRGQRLVVARERGLCGQGRDMVIVAKADA